MFFKQTSANIGVQTEREVIVDVLNTLLDVV